MGECKLCRRRGLFVFVNQDGLCSRCAKEMQEVALSDTEIEKLDRQARARSAEFASVHKTALKKFSDVEALRQIRPGVPGSLSMEEILFLWYLNGNEANPECVAGYWTHDYHIDYGSASKRLFSYGYLSFADMKVRLSSQKVPELKKVLTDNGFPVSGRKEALVQRILESIPKEKLERAFPKEYYSLTPAGAKLVMENDHLVYVHRHRAQFGISLETANKIKSANPNFTCYEVALSALEKEGLRVHREKDWGLWRNTLHNRSVVYQEQGKIAEELELLLQVNYIDARGYGNGDDLSPHLAFLAPALIHRTKAICSGESISRDMLFAKFKEAVSKLDIRDKTDVKEAFSALWAEIEGTN